MTTPFRFRHRVEFVETDMAGVVHFSNYFLWMEAAETAFLRSRGLSVALTWQGRPLGFPRVAVSCDYLAPVRFEDEVDITVKVERLGRKSLTYVFDFLNGSQPVARGKATAVCCFLEPGRPMEAVPIPEEVRHKLEEV